MVCHGTQETMSQEIDILVRDHIIRRPDPTRCECCGGPLKTTVEDGCVPDTCSARPLTERKFADPVPYSTNIAAAWQVLEALRPVHLELHYFPDRDSWQCNIGNGPLTHNYRMTQDQWQKTAPMAICFAALKAVGHKSSEEVDHSQAGSADCQ
jgi:Phage ABA sandwich domain